MAFAQPGLGPRALRVSIPSLPSDAVALALLPQCTGRNKETRGSALDSIYSITVRTARKADELTDGEACSCMSAWDRVPCLLALHLLPCARLPLYPLPALDTRPNRTTSKLRIAIRPLLSPLLQAPTWPTSLSTGWRGKWSRCCAARQERWGPPSWAPRPACSLTRCG